MTNGANRIPEGPYKGLMPYSEEDAPFFFGRESEREIIIANLMAFRLTLLYGPSGVGKSSVLRAGVVHHLGELAKRNLAERGEPEFAIVYFNSWRDDPLAGLVMEVQKSVGKALNFQAAEPASNSRRLDKILQELAQSLGGDLFIILDQFEEYFLYHGQEEGEGSFAVEFPRAVNRADLRASFLVSIRDDGLAKLDQFKGSIPSLFDNYLRIDHLKLDGAREAICRPIVEWNRIQELKGAGQEFEIESPLAEAVLDQVRTGRVILGEAGKGRVAEVPEKGISAAGARIETPYLQLVMTRLWKEENQSGSHVLRLSTLVNLGGAEKIVNSHFDVEMEKLSDLGREICARIFHYLVTPSGSKIAYVTSDLVSLAGRSDEEVIPLLETLSDARILKPVPPPLDRPESPRYEIFHDVLAPAILAWRARHALHEAWVQIRPWAYLREVLTGRVQSLPRGVVTIGRSVKYWQNVVNLSAKLVSRVHAFVFEDGSLFDMRSLNGTTLNAWPLPYGQPARLENGDIITLAGVPLEFERITYSEQEDPRLRDVPRMNEQAPLLGWGILIGGGTRVRELHADQYALILDATEERIHLREQATGRQIRLERSSDGKVTLRNESSAEFTRIEREFSPVTYADGQKDVLVGRGYIEIPNEPDQGIPVSPTMIFRYGQVHFQIVWSEPPE